MRALVVDDAHGMRHYLSTLLRTRGFDSVEACDGIEALKHTSDAGIDLIVTDIQMPRLNGIELIDLIQRGAFGTPAPPVIVCSGRLDVQDQPISLELSRCAAVIAKPFDADQFFEALTQVFPEF